jgi:hypothetical protein
MVDMRSDAVELADAQPAAVAAPAGRCPIDHSAFTAATCPFPMGNAGERTIERSKADMVVRRLLRIRERPAGVSANAVYATFQRSMLISATRCLLTYIVFPFVLPAAGFATGVGPILGIVIGTLSMTCDVFTVRRVFQVDHKWRWHFSAVAVCVIGLLSVLLVQDIIHLAS